MESIHSQASGQPAELQPAVAPSSSRLRTLLRILVVAYGASIVSLWAWMTWDGDRGPLATLVLFGPRWMCAIPLPALALAAIFVDRRALGPLALVAAVIVGPIMGLRLRLPPLATVEPELRVLTCNVDENHVRPSSLAALVAQWQLDVVSLQEVSTATRFLWPPGWHVVLHDEFLLASRYRIEEREHVTRVTKPVELAGIRYLVQTPNGEVQIFNLHFESPRPGLEAVLTARRGIDLSRAAELEAVIRLRARESEKVSRWIASFPGPKIVMGDFNMPCDSTIWRRDWSDLVDGFSVAGRGFGFTKISEKRGWSYGARIDHVLASPPWRCRECLVASDIGSDHLPLVAEFSFH